MPSDILAESLLTCRSFLGDSNGARKSQAKEQNLKSKTRTDFRATLAVGAFEFGSPGRSRGVSDVWGVVREGCLSERFLWTSSVAASHIVSDEGMPTLFVGTTGRGGIFFGYLLCCCRQNRRERFWTCEAWPVGWITWTARGCEYPLPTTVQNWKN